MNDKKYGAAYQWARFLEHWVLLPIAIVAMIVSQVLMFFTNLNGTPWIYFFGAAFVLLSLGAALIIYAKLPGYRRGQFFTFGVKSVPDRLAGCYRWGWRVILFGVVLALCLLLSRQ